MLLGAQSPEDTELALDLDSAEFIKQKQIEQNLALMEIEDEALAALTQSLRSKLDLGSQQRLTRIIRYGKIDRMISTWQKLSKEDSERERIEDNSGRQFAIPFNIPVLASYLTDMTSYFAEALAPISNPFSASDGTPEMSVLTKRLNQDALARDYYGELVLTIRSLLKYNIGGMHVTWDPSGEGAMGISGINQAGNQWESLCMYNTIWDPSVKNPRDIPYRAEFAATTRMTNRYEMAKKAASGEWVGLNQILKGGSDRYNGDTDAGTLNKIALYQDPAMAVPSADKLDSRSSYEYSDDQLAESDWVAIGLGTPGSTQATQTAFELTTMYCWIIPDEYGLVNETMQLQMREEQNDPSVTLQLWKFELIDGCVIVSASPVVDSGSSSPLIPFYMSYMTSDQLAESQRSSLELMRGFQRFTSAMHSIYVEGMRANVWGVRGFDPEMFDISALKKGETSAWLGSKVPGRDVRTGLTRLDSGSGVDEAMRGVEQSMSLKDQLFPNQALPSQISGMDRAVTSQVTSVVQGAQRPLRMLLRLIDSSMMMRTRMAAVRNIQTYDTQVQSALEGITDEDVAKSLGSGIESMEAERIVEQFWRLLMAVTQNQEAMQTYDVPAIMAYVGRLMNLTVDMSTFVKQQPQPEGVVPPEGAPPPPTA